MNSSPTVELLKIILPFIAALIGGLVGAPLLEIIKDRINASRKEKDALLRISDVLDYFYGRMDVFLYFLDKVHNPNTRAAPHALSLYKEALKRFDMSSAEERVDSLTTISRELYVELTTFLLMTMELQRRLSEAPDGELSIDLSELITLTKNQYKCISSMDRDVIAKRLERSGIKFSNAETDKIRNVRLIRDIFESTSAVRLSIEKVDAITRKDSAISPSSKS